MPTSMASHPKVNAVPLGVLSCALGVLLALADVIFTASFLRMSVQQKVNFVIAHSDAAGMLRGAEMVGLPVAVLLGLLSRKTIVGKAGLAVAVLLLAADLYRYLFGLPVSLGPGIGTPHP